MYTHELVTEKRRYGVARRHPRFIISVPVIVTRRAMPDSPVVHGLSLDISRGGASAVLCGPPSVGEIVYLSLQFSEASLESLAVVRHSDAVRSGFEFVDLSPAHRELLEGWLQALQERPWPWRRETVKPTFVP
jgi:c-di-GMP-binding flagellar brake protein YcgR